MKIFAFCLLLSAVMASQSPPAATAERLSGRWHLNEAQSRLPTTKRVLAEKPSQRGAGVIRSEPATEGQMQFRAMTEEEVDAPADLVIVATEKTLSIIDAKGTPRRFTITGAREKLDLFLVTANVSTRWDAEALKQDITSGQFRLVRTYQVSDRGEQLVVTSLLSGAPLLEMKDAPPVPVPVRLVYDKVR